MTWFIAAIAWIIGFIAAWVLFNVTKKENNKTNWGE